MKMRATWANGFTDVRVLMTHPMETGQRKDSEGNLVPMHFIQTVTVQLNGKTVVECQASQGVSPTRCSPSASRAAPAAIR